MANFYLIEQNGERLYVDSLLGRGNPTIIAELDRIPDEFEYWDDATQSFQMDMIRKADTTAGADHIKTCHLIKQVEAAMIVSGYELEAGLLYEEAQELGLDLLELAQTVLEKSSQRRSKELSRRSIKVDVNS